MHVVLSISCHFEAVHFLNVLHSIKCKNHW